MTAKRAAEIRDWLMAQVAALVGVAPDEIDTRTTFDTYGLASREAIGLSGDIEEWLGLRLAPSILYQYTTIDALAGHLAGLTGAAPAATGSVAPAAGLAPEAPASAPGDAIDDDAEAALIAKLAQLD